MNRGVLACAALSFVAAFAGAFTATAVVERRRQVHSSVHIHNAVEVTPEQAADEIIARIRAGRLP